MEWNLPYSKVSNLLNGINIFWELIFKKSFHYEIIIVMQWWAILHTRVQGYSGVNFTSVQCNIFYMYNSISNCNLDYLTFDPSVLNESTRCFFFFFFQWWPHTPHTCTHNTPSLVETGTMVLQFAPSAARLSFYILVFINDELDQTEEYVNFYS